MKKITLLLALVATAFVGNAQNPFVDNTYTVHTVGSLGTTGNPVDVSYVVNITVETGADDFTISDVTGGLYPVAYSDGGDNPASVMVNSADQTLSIVDQPDVVYEGGDVFNGSGTYTTDANGDVISFEYAWSNGYGDSGTSTFTLYTETEAPAEVSTPTPADGATEVVVSGADENEDGSPDNSLTFSWEAATTGGAATGYDFYIAIDDPAGLTDPLLTTGETTVSLINVPLAATIYWKVIATNPNGDATATTWSFTTAATADIAEFDVYGFNYFMNDTTQELNLSADTQINQVRIFNLLGQEVANKDVSGLTATFNLSNLRSGIYIAQVNIDGKTESFKFVKK